MLRFLSLVLFFLNEGQSAGGRAPSQGCKEHRALAAKLAFLLEGRPRGSSPSLGRILLIGADTIPGMDTSDPSLSPVSFGGPGFT